jgi:restriction system protein
MNQRQFYNGGEHVTVQFFDYFGADLDALRALGDSGTPDEVAERVATDLKLSDSELNELMPYGLSRYQNRARWARFYLAQEGLIDSSQRGVWSFTESGRQTHLDREQAHQLYVKWNRIFAERRKTRAGAQSADADNIASEPTADSIAPDTADLQADYKAKLLSILKDLSPSGFERLSQRILREAGFSFVEVTGRTGDGGIDGAGTLRLNALVSIKILFQCKRYKDSVSSGQIRDFRGAMQGRADKGLMITTGSFTADARREASRDGVPAVELIDGTRLVEMLERLKIGLRPRETFEVDERFFDEFRS